MTLLMLIACGVKAGDEDVRYIVDCIKEAIAE